MPRRPSLPWREGHPMGDRPRAWYGPEDHDGVTDPLEATLERYVEQRLWDLIYRGLPFRQRCACHWNGQVVEPVGLYGRDDDGEHRKARLGLLQR